MTSAARPGRPTVLLFTWAAGSVDALTYLSAHVFTANMTGNTVLLGIAAGQGHAGPVISSFLALLAFVAGVIIGALVVGEGESSVAARAVRRAVWVETFLLALFAVAALPPLHLPGHSIALWFIVSSGTAMGLQSAAVRRLKMPGIATTYITGTITSLFSGVVHGFRHRSGAHGVTVTLGLKHSMALQAEVFLSYAVAAGICAVLHTHWPAGVAFLPFMALIAVDISLARSASG